MRTLAVFTLLVLATNLALAQKSPELDRSKTQSSIEECKRIADWQLLKNSKENFKISCEEDNIVFASNIKRSQVGGKLRLGNFNLLHPGTDKTIFKDFGLVGDLVNSEFDVMAGVELTDVVADAKKNNKKLLPLLEGKYGPVAASSEAVNDQLAIVKKLEEKIGSTTGTSTGPSAEDKAQIEAFKNQLSKIDSDIKTNSESLITANADVESYSKPILVIFGIEFFKRARLEHLRVAKEEKAKLEKEKVSLEQNRKATADYIVSLENKAKNSVPQVSNEDKAQLALEKEKLNKLKNVEAESWSGFAQFSKGYRIPGYLMLLEKLRELDPSWSLIVSPHMDAAKETTQQELAGFYFRSNRLSLANNIHCTKRFVKDSSGCIPNFSEEYLEEDMTNFFSRRPFMTTFNDGKSNFSLIAAHVIFDPTSIVEEQQLMLSKVFGVSKISEIGKGVSSDNYARFAEVKLTLTMIEKLRAEGVERIIYTGDFNLESTNAYWKKLWIQFPGQKLLVDTETSLSEVRFAAGKETKGGSSNYDHFLLSEEDNKSCMNADRVDFVNNEFSKKIKDKYLTREEAPKGPYQKSADADQKIAARKAEMEPRLEMLNYVLVKGEVKADAKLVANDLKNFEQRVFGEQYDDSNYYKLFVQIISDHMPIKMECQFE